MKQSIIILLMTIVTIGCFAQKFDKRLAKKLGADEYGMKNYVLVILKTGETTISDKQQRDSIFAGHMKNIGRMADAGLLAAEYFSWYASAALPLHNKYHKKKSRRKAFDT